MGTVKVGRAAKIGSGGPVTHAGVPVPETLTESFCERCGTRFQFEPPAKPKPLTKLRVLSRGLKSYVLTDGSSLTDVMASARTDEERRRASAQLDQFHETFKFCMECRQYTCAACWNFEAGVCLSCAPVEDVPTVPLEPPVAAAGAAAEAVPAWEPAAPDVPVVMAAPIEPSPVERVVPTPAPQTRPVPVAERAAEVPAAAKLNSAPVAEPVRAPVLPPTPAPVHASVPPAVVAPVRVAATSPVVAPVQAAPTPAAAIAPTSEMATMPSPAVAAAPAPEPTYAPGLPPAAEPAHSAPRSAVAPAAEAPDFDDILARLDFVAREHHDPTPVSRSAFEQSHLWARRMAGGATPRADTRPTADASVASSAPAEPRPEPVIPVVEAAPVPVVPGMAAADPAPVAALAAEETLVAEEPAAAEEPVPDEIPVTTEEPASDEIAVAAEEPVAAEAPALVEEPVAAEVPVAADEPAAAPVEEPAPKKADDIWWIVAPDESRRGSDAPTQPTWTIPTRAPQPVPAPVPLSARPAQPVVRPPAPPAAPTIAWPTVPPASAPSPAIAAAQHQQGHAKVATSDAVWAASSRDVLNRPGSGAQACVSCGLALSAAARFCRRCGSSQS